MEGVMSLARAFMEIGAPQVVASLWDVEDSAAERIFDRFYNALSGGNSVTDALRAAQLSLVSSRDPRVRSPRYWAPFVVFGGELGSGHQGNQ
jgi:CHAT domain-containing protein